MNKEYVFVGNAQNKTRDFINRLIKENKDLKHQLEEKTTKEEAFKIWLTNQFNKTQDIKYLDILMKHKEILERGKNEKIY